MNEAEKPYSWFSDVTNFTSKLSEFIVVVGIDGEGVFIASGDVLQVKEAGGNIVDSWELETFGVAANEVILGLPRRILIPPLGSLTSTNAARFQGVVCHAYMGKSSLENALAIL